MTAQVVRNRTRHARSTRQREAVLHVPGTAVGATAQPGLDGLPMLRTSERGTFKRCHWKWYHEFELDMKPKTDKPPLRFGTIIHQSLARYYIPGTKRGVRPWLTFNRLYKKECREQEGYGFRVADDDAWVSAGDLGPDMLKRYVEHYGTDDEWEVIHTEMPFQVLVYKPWTYDPNHPPEAQATAEPWFWYVGVIDGVWRNRSTGKIHIVDHKTARAIIPMYLSLDPQATAYWTWGLDFIYAKGILKPGEKPAGMLFNMMRKALEDQRPFQKDEKGRKHYLNKPTKAELKKYGENYPGSISKVQPAEYFARIPIYRDINEREEARQQILFEFADIENVRRAGTIDGAPPPEAYKNQGQFTCAGCWLFDFCELNEIGASWQEMREHVVKSWEPYAAHETYAAETK